MLLSSWKKARPKLKKELRRNISIILKKEKEKEKEEADKIAMLILKYKRLMSN